MASTEKVLAELDEKLAHADSHKRVMVGRREPDTYRYLLGVPGTHPLVVFGVNPSTASDLQDDATISRVRRMAELTRCDSWIMLNLYPQRSTNPRGLHEDGRENQSYIEANLAVMAEVLKRYPNAFLVAAWGNLVDSRRYLRQCCASIVSLAAGRQWHMVGTPTKAGNPHHPLRTSLAISRVELDSSGRVAQL